MEYHHWRTSKDSASHALEDQRMSKDRTNLEALKDNTPVPLEDSSLDDAAREDTMREDAPLATSHDPSLPLPNKADTPMDDLP
jgi:hypothetical protein